MTQVSFNGSGTAQPLPDVVGIGEGLQVGLTEIDFESGTVSLLDNSGHANAIGRFVGLHGSDGEPALKAFVFKSKVTCTVKIDQNSFNYETINQWITFNHLNVSRIQIIRTPSGQNPDVFDFNVIGSDDPEYRFTIQPSSKQSETEVAFAQSQRAANTYTQNMNLHGAKKIIVVCNSPASVETGQVDVTAEIFDVATNTWKQLIPATDLAAGLIQNQSKLTMIGDDVERPTEPTNTEFVGTSGGILGNSYTVNYIRIGYILPSGDQIFRFKAVVSVAPLTFSVSVIKVFD